MLLVAVQHLHRWAVEAMFAVVVDGRMEICSAAIVLTVSIRFVRHGERAPNAQRGEAISPQKYQL